MGFVNLSSAGTMTAGDSAVIAGLPFTSVNVALSHHSISVGQNQGMLLGTAGFGVQAMVPPNTTFISLQLNDATSGDSALLISEYSTGAIFVAGTYEAA